jgi:hypothetical protein
MEVLCNVLAVNRSVDPQSKVKARIQLLTKFPLQAMEITLFEHNVKNGILARFEALAGKDAIVPIEMNEYKGRTQYQLPFDSMPYPLDQIIGKSTANEPPLKNVGVK